MCIVSCLFHKITLLLFTTLYAYIDGLFSLLTSSMEPKDCLFTPVLKYVLLVSAQRFLKSFKKKVATKCFNQIYNIYLSIIESVPSIKGGPP